MLNQRDPVLIADTGPLLRLAAAGLLDSMCLTNRQIVIVDMVEHEACHRDPERPFAKDILSWIERSGGAVSRIQTREGMAFKFAQLLEKTPNNLALLKKMQRDSGDRAVRDFIEDLEPKELRSVLVVHEDQQVPKVMRMSAVPIHLMTTRLFLQVLARQGMNIDLDAALKAIRDVPFSLAEAEETRIRPLNEPDYEDTY